MEFSTKTPSIECPNCKYEGKPKYFTKGSMASETIIWIFGIIFAFFTYGITIFVPIIYSLWRQFSKYYGCPKCNYANVIKK